MFIVFVFTIDSIVMFFVIIFLVVVASLFLACLFHCHSCWLMAMMVILCRDGTLVALFFSLSLATIGIFVFVVRRCCIQLSCPPWHLLSSLSLSTIVAVAISVFVVVVNYYSLCLDCWLLLLFCRLRCCRRRLFLSSSFSSWSWSSSTTIFTGVLFYYCCHCLLSELSCRWFCFCCSALSLALSSVLSSVLSSSLVHVVICGWWLLIFRCWHIIIVRWHYYCCQKRLWLLLSSSTLFSFLLFPLVRNFTRSKYQWVL